MNADKINALYAGEIFSAETQRLARERIHWMCRQARGKSVLDIGCSQGIVPLLLGREGFNCTGIDYEKDSIEYARQELQKEEEIVQNRVKFDQLDATSLPFEDDTFDTVIMGEILEHLTNPARILKEAKRVLKTGGVVVITVPFGLNPAPDHKTTYYPSTLLELVAPYFETMTVEATDANLLYTGSKGHTQNTGVVTAESVPHLQKSLEKRCLIKELALYETTTELYKKINTLTEAVQFHKDATEKLKQALVTCEQRDAAILGEQKKQMELAKAIAKESVDALSKEYQQAVLTHASTLKDLADERRAAMDALQTQLSAQHAQELQAKEAIIADLRVTMQSEAESAVSMRQEMSDTIANIKKESEEFAQEILQFRQLLAEKEADMESLRLLNALNLDDLQLSKQLNEEWPARLAAKDEEWQARLAAKDEEWQARLAAKDEELKLKLAEKRLDMEYALANQEKEFRTAYSWRLGSVVTGAVVLAANTVKRPKHVGRHLKQYIATVNPDTSPVTRPTMPLKQISSAAIAATPATSVALPPPLMSGIRKDKIALGCILDEFTAENFRPECQMITFRPDNWKEVLEAKPPHALFVESAWRGNEGAWLYRVAKYAKNMGDELEQLTAWARAKNIPSFFWNKEDPVHFDRFIPNAKFYDYIFTSDADCIPRYREALGHDRIFALPFAAQPRIQNPIIDQSRVHRACFAGTYYGDSFPDRQKDMEYLLRPALDFGLDIYDRQFGMVGPEAAQYRFPDIYQPSIKGRLDFTEMVKAYKQYKVFLNVNSVKESPTMFSRRVFELLACGTPVISTYSKGIEEVFGTDLVLLTESEADTRKHLDKLFSDEDYCARLSVRGIRHVMGAHTYSHRMNYMLNCMGMNCAPDTEVFFSILASVNSQNDLDSLQESLLQQTYRRFEVTIVSGSKVKKAQLQKVIAAMEPLRVVSVHEDSPQSLEQAIARAKTDYICFMKPSDYYGPNYLKDYALALKYCDANYIGKETHFGLKSDRVELYNLQKEFRYTSEVPVATLAIKRSIVDLKYLHKLIANPTFRINEPKILSLDRFNYLSGHHHTPSPHAPAKLVDV